MEEKEKPPTSTPLGVSRLYGLQRSKVLSVVCRSGEWGVEVLELLQVAFV